LTNQLKDEEPPVSNIECQVTKQQLLSRRVLADSGFRRLEDFSSLLVDLLVTGTATSEVYFDDMIYDAFDADGAFFVETLKNKGAAAGIAIFDEVHSMSLVQQSNEKATIVEESEAAETERMSGPLILLVTVACVVVALIGIVGYTRMSTHSDVSIAKAPTDEEGLIGAMDPENPETAASGSVFGELGSFLKSIQTQESGINVPFMPGCGGQSAEAEPTQPYVGPSTDAKSTEPDQKVSRNATTSASWSQMDTSFSGSDESEISPSGPRVRREIEAPPGILGVIMDCSDQGPIVYSVKKESPLRGIVHKGDLIVGLDGMDTSHLSSSGLTKLMAARKQHTRRITVLSLKCDF
jgi:hypothetical protein